MSDHYAAGLQVLVVDDSLVNRTLLTHWLEQAGAMTLQAGSLREARVILATTHPSHMVIDQQLPDGTGDTLLAEFGEKQAGVWIATTAAVTDAQAWLATHKGFAHLLNKPIDRNHLRTILLAERETTRTPAAGIGAAEAGLLPVLDYPSALRRLGGDEAMMHELIASFVKESADLPDTLWAAWRSRDLRLLARQAHTAAGLAGQFGLLSLTQRLQLLEMAVSQGSELSASYVEPLLQAVAHAFDIGIPRLARAGPAPERAWGEPGN